MVSRDPSSDPERSPEAALGRREGLALLYQGILTAIVRIQSGKQPIPPDTSGLQRQMETLLAEIEREAVKLGYRNQDVRDSHYAVVAFLDEAIRRSDNENRVHWTPLAVKLFSDADAGVGIYERLRSIRSRRDSLDLAEVLEVYYLCFLLGYEGKYALGARAELERLMEDLGEQIERIRGHKPALSPDGALPEAQKIGVPATARPDHWGRIAVICVVVACLSWVLMKLVLNTYTEGVIREMLSF